jgi:hypothetical protein
MQTLADGKDLKIERRDDGAGWAWVVSDCGWPPLSGRAPSPASAERTVAFASGVLGALSRIGRRRF